MLWSSGGFPLTTTQRIKTAVHSDALPFSVPVPTAGIVFAKSVCPDPSGDPCIDITGASAQTQDALRQSMSDDEREAYDAVLAKMPSAVRQASKKAGKVADKIANDFVAAVNQAWKAANKEAVKAFGPGHSVEFSYHESSQGNRIVARVTVHKDHASATVVPSVSALKKLLKGLV